MVVVRSDLLVRQTVDDAVPCTNYGDGAAGQVVRSDVAQRKLRGIRFDGLGRGLRNVRRARKERTARALAGRRAWVGVNRVQYNAVALAVLDLDRFHGEAVAAGDVKPAIPLVDCPVACRCRSTAEVVAVKRQSYDPPVGAIVDF